MLPILFIFLSVGLLPIDQLPVDYLLYYCAQDALALLLATKVKDKAHQCSIQRLYNTNITSNVCIILSLFIVERQTETCSSLCCLQSVYLPHIMQTVGAKILVFSCSVCVYSLCLFYNLLFSVLLQASH